MLLKLFTLTIYCIFPNMGRLAEESLFLTDIKLEKNNKMFDFLSVEMEKIFWLY